MRTNRGVVLGVLLAAVAGAAVLALVLTGSLGGPAPAGPETVTVRGSLSVLDTCPPGGGYRDIHAGAQVKVTDAAGAVVAVSELGPGQREVDKGLYMGCRFNFVVPDVPAGRDFYGVQVGSERRGVMTVPAAKIGEPIELSLGY